MSYKNILNVQINQFNFYYKKICKEKPYLSIDEKKGLALHQMMKDRKIDNDNIFDLSCSSGANSSWSLNLQYKLEILTTSFEVFEGIERYYIKDDSLFDFFKNTEIRHKEVEYILNSELINAKNFCKIWGMLGKDQSYTIVCSMDKTHQRHFITVLTDEMNYSFCIEDLKQTTWVYNLAMNFLFYINAFPECVIDGVPQGAKKNPSAKVISVSDKIVTHTTVEHGFVRPHFRSGYFRHFNSDYFVNCKGQIRFISSTMVKGKAKTVISKEEDKK